MLILSETKDRNGKSVFEVCTKESTANALLDMAVQGLSPAKKQCYFVIYGNKLQLMRSYFGSVAVAKRLGGVQDVFAHIIYKNDKFKHKINLDTGVIEILEHDQNFENIGTEIRGAYAVVVMQDGRKYVEIMNINQIQSAWGQGTMKGNSPAHQRFGDQMAKKTVINRAIKMFVNTSDDSDLLIESYNRTLDNEFEEKPQTTNVELEIKQETAQEDIGQVFEEVQEVQEVQEQEPELDGIMF
jgi:recombination protein RecT